ncbi:hypothetical protein GCM10009780_17720 [Actinomadura alba]
MWLLDRYQGGDGRRRARSSGQNCDGALVRSKAPIGTRLLRAGGSKHHVELTADRSNTRHPKGQLGNGSGSKPK